MSERLGVSQGKPCRYKGLTASVGKDVSDIEKRIVRLELANRRLVAFCAITLAGLFAYGFQTTNDIVRAGRIEIVDAKGVPLATLGPARGGAGGELILRDRDGERRATLTAEPGAASLGLQGGKVDDPSGTAALRSDGDGARLGLVGSRAAISAGVRKDRPRIATTDTQGRETFAAPWK